MKSFKWLYILCPESTEATTALSNCISTCRYISVVPGGNNLCNQMTLQKVSQETPKVLADDQ